MTHALIVGGTGMLRGVALHLAGAVDTVSVVARNPARLESLAREARSLRKPALLSPISVDYTRTADLARAVRAAAADHGPITLAVAWIHSTAPDALPAVARAISESGPARLFHITGASAADPALENAAGLLRALPNLRYRRITLGFIIEPTGTSRWLTSAEIATGITRAIELDTPETTIGTTTPRSARPK